jgi:GTP cyclohydrolase I
VNGKEEGAVPDGNYESAGKTFPGNGLVLEAVRTLLRHVGEDPDRDGLKDTPGRVLRSLVELTAGYHDDPAKILGTVFEDTYDEIVVVRGIPFTSLCEHHLLPFSGEADVGYLPGSKGIVGLSKIARLVDCYSRRLQVQERLTRQVADALATHLAAPGVGVVVRAVHTCMSCRGVRKPGVTMVTSAMLGVFRDCAPVRAELLTLFRG